MSDKYPGGIITKTPVVPAGPYQDGAAPGIWTLEQQAYYAAQGTWPTAGNVWTPLNSLRIRKSASANLTRTPASASNRKTWTWSGWVKRGALDASYQSLLEVWNGNNDNQCFNISWTDADQIMLGAYSVLWRVSTPVYRDPSSWYHVVVAVDTTQATAANRLKIYINNSQVTSFGTSNDPTQNSDLAINQAATHYTGSGNSRSYSDGYLAQINFIDGQALTPSSFGQTDATTGVWQAKQYSGTYGTNGYYLPFSDIALTSGSNAGLGKDFSGNGNYWTTNNISVTSGVTYDAMTDVPANKSATIANYATLNPLTSSSTTTYGNLRIAGAFNAKSTIQLPTTGTWYAEATFTTVATTAYGIDFGLIDATGNIYALIRAAGSTVQIAGTGGSTTYNSYSTFSNGDIASLAYDASNGTLNFYKNNVLAATVSSMTVGTKYFIRAGGDGASDVVDVNFGQRPFAYTPPSGYIALNTYNLATPTILQGDDYFGAGLYTGTGSSSPLAVSGPNTPDFVWIKCRSSASSHSLLDKLRSSGTPFSLRLYSNNTNAEYNYGSSLLTPTSTGFNLTTSDGDHNTNGQTYVAWQWKANGAGVSNTDGSITSTVSVNTTSKFSIVTYTGNGSAGATIGHGLGATPSIIIVKRRDTSANWPVLLKDATGDEIAYLNLTNKSTPSGNESIFGNNSVYVAPTSTVFTVGTNTTVNANGGTYVAYLFSSVSGFSAFGNYTGNGSSNGPFVYCGFRPAYVIVKNIDALGDWPILDNARDTYNVEQYGLYANTSGSESDFGSPTPMYDFLSNGFKVRNTYANTNTNGSRYAYMAFAENPFKYALAR